MVELPGGGKPIEGGFHHRATEPMDPEAAKVTLTACRGIYELALRTLDRLEAKASEGEPVAQEIAKLNSQFHRLAKSHLDRAIEACRGDGSASELIDSVQALYFRVLQRTEAVAAILPEKDRTKLHSSELSAVRVALRAHRLAKDQLSETRPIDPEALKSAARYASLGRRGLAAFVVEDEGWRIRDDWLKAIGLLWAAEAAFENGDRARVEQQLARLERRIGTLSGEAPDHAVELEPRSRSIEELRSALRRLRSLLPEDPKAPLPPTDPTSGEPLPLRTADEIARVGREIVERYAGRELEMLAAFDEVLDALFRRLDDLRVQIDRAEEGALDELFARRTKVVDEIVDVRKRMCRVEHEAKSAIVRMRTELLERSVISEEEARSLAHRIAITDTIKPSLAAQARAILADTIRLSEGRVLDELTSIVRRHLVELSTERKIDPDALAQIEARAREIDPRVRLTTEGSKLKLTTEVAPGPLIRAVLEVINESQSEAMRVGVDVFSSRTPATRGNMIDISSTSTPEELDVALRHELFHHLERREEIGRASIEWLQNRSGRSEPVEVPLSDVTSDPRDERARLTLFPVDFVNRYIGRVYVDEDLPGSEVTSVSGEYFGTPSEMLALLSADRSLFELVLGAMRS